VLLLDRLDQPKKGFGTRAGELLAKASSLGIITTVDVVSEESDRYSRVVLPVLPFIDIIFLNEFEAARIISFEIREGGRIHTPALVRAARGFLDAGVRQWVVIVTWGRALLVTLAGRRFICRRA
jgi:sugar/nucleoside kinase (ribokinase family)